MIFSYSAVLVRSRSRSTAQCSANRGLFYVKCKRSPIAYSIRALGPEMIQISRQSTRKWLVINPAIGCHYPSVPAVTFPAEESHRPLASTKLYCLVTEARCETGDWHV